MPYIYRENLEPKVTKFSRVWKEFVCVGGREGLLIIFFLDLPNFFVGFKISKRRGRRRRVTYLLTLHMYCFVGGRPFICRAKMGLDLLTGLQVLKKRSKETLKIKQTG